MTLHVVSEAAPEVRGSIVMPLSAAAVVAMTEATNSEKKNFAISYLN